LSPEPYAYEEAFGVQRLIVAQIDGTADTYSGNVSYPNDAPWFDWGPYLWANGDTGRSDGLRWCDTTSNFTCAGKLDFRYGQTGGADDYLWGDHTHPSAQGAGRVSGLILDFLGRTPHQRNAFVPWLDAP
jgi:hypothetical protein